MLYWAHNYQQTYQLLIIIEKDLWKKCQHASSSLTVFIIKYSKDKEENYKANFQINFSQKVLDQIFKTFFPSKAIGPN